MKNKTNQLYQVSKDITQSCIDRELWVKGDYDFIIDEIMDAISANILEDGAVGKSAINDIVGIIEFYSGEKCSDDLKAEIEWILPYSFE